MNDKAITGNAEPQSTGLGEMLTQLQKRYDETPAQNQAILNQPNGDYYPPYCPHCGNRRNPPYHPDTVPWSDPNKYPAPYYPTGPYPTPWWTGNEFVD